MNRFKNKYSKQFNNYEKFTFINYYLLFSLSQKDYPKKKRIDKLR